MNNESNENIAVDTPMYNPDETTASTIQDSNEITLETIHNDLGFICSFLIIFGVLILMKIIYSFFRIFF